MARMNFRRPTAVASIAALMALAALPSAAMADEPGWRGGDRAATAQGQSHQGLPRGDWRGGGEARGNSDQSQAERSRARAEAAQQQRVRSEQRSPTAGWRGRLAPEENARADAPRPERPPINRATTERPSWSRSGNPAQGNGAEQRRWQAQQQRDRADVARRERERDRANVGRPTWEGDRNNRPGWTGNRVDPNRRYDNGRVVNGQRWDDDRRWSYSNGRYQWNKSWRNDKRYDWRGYRTQYRSIYSPGRYYAPYSNYYYRTMLVGNYLDTGFYGDRYWLNDPWEYRLPAAYGPYRWIRYFDDALLVNIHTGMVADTIRNFFW